MFSGISFVGLIILFFILPETKDRSLEEVEELFMSKEYKKKLKAQSEKHVTEWGFALNDMKTLTINEMFCSMCFIFKESQQKQDPTEWNDKIPKSNSITTYDKATLTLDVTKCSIAQSLAIAVDLY